MTSTSTELLAIGIGKESAFGTAVAPTCYIVADPSSKFEMEHQPILHKGKIGKRANLQKTSAGPQSVKGTIKLRPEAENIGEILRAFFGQDTVASLGSGAYSHTMSPIEASQTDSLTIAVDRGMVDGRHNYVGCIPDKLEIEFDDQGPVMMSADFIGRDEEDGDVLTPTISDLEPFVFHQVEVTLGIATVACKKGKITMKNNVTLQRGIQGNGVRTAQSYTVGEIEVEFELSMFFESATLRDQWKNATESNLEIAMTGAAINGSDNYSLVIAITKTIFGKGEFAELDKAYGVEISGSAKYDRDAGKLIEVTLTNTKAVAY